MLAVQADRVVSLAEWEERWQQNRIGFHRPHVNKLLERNIKQVVNGRTGVRFFFPLCGKAVDMKWLADMGHSVVGVEIAEKAILQFYEDNNMSYAVEPVPSIPGAKVYKNVEKSISIYHCDLYKFNSCVEGQFGAIWDRGSLVAINPEDREKYASLLLSLMAEDCRYLLSTLLYNPEQHKGPPFLVPNEQILALFGESSESTAHKETATQEGRLRLNLDGDDLDRKRKSGVAFSLLIQRLDECLWGEMCVHTVTQKCVN
uniref:thiopurine S-methyltransferase n=1 Tax=Gadus morhua TaxID=8049 RepID=A0A8C5B7X6_GADMO